jgi:hypothetical protein
VVALNAVFRNSPGDTEGSQGPFRFSRCHGRPYVGVH